MTSINSIKKIVLKKITPSKKELYNGLKVADELSKKIIKAGSKAKKVCLAGSFARNTFLPNSKDLDFFVLFDCKFPKKKLNQQIKLIARKTLVRFEQAFAEHPYVKGKYKNFNVELIPAYDISCSLERISAVDRSVLHQDFLIKRLNSKLRKEIRLLKQFLKAIDLYGAEIKIQGFSGYLTELLILHYRSFENLLKAAKKWKKEVIDISRHYNKKDYIKLFKKFKKRLIVIDPVDENRNVAAALSEEQLNRFILAAHAFLLKPSIKFFLPEKRKLFSITEIKKRLNQSSFIGFYFKKPNAIEDTLFGQLRRFQSFITSKLKENDFVVLRSSFHSNEFILLLFELESIKISKEKLHLGPRIYDSKQIDSFLKKQRKIVSGPFFKNERILIELIRPYNDALVLLNDLKKSITKNDFKFLYNVIKKGKIISNHDLIKLSSKNSFKKFLTCFLLGNEEFCFL